MTKTSPDLINLHIGKRLRTARKLLGITLEEIASELGLSYQQIQKYEKGHARIPASTLMRIADILGQPPNYFFGGMINYPAHDIQPGIPRTFAIQLAEYEIQITVKKRE